MIESPNFEISAEEVMKAFHDTFGSNYKYQISVQKEELRPARRVESINQNCSELSEQQRQKFVDFCSDWGGRTPIHLYRMLRNGRSEVERDFALDVVENLEVFNLELKESDIKTMSEASDEDVVDLLEDRLSATLNSESTDAGAFWTFAPYIYKNLKGDSKKDRLRKIINWALLPDVSKEELDAHDGYKNIHLKGLREIYQSLGDLYYLPNDPKYAFGIFIDQVKEEELKKLERNYKLIHNFTDQEAKKLVQEGVFD